MAAVAVARQANKAQNARLEEQKKEAAAMQQVMMANETFNNAEDRDTWLATHDKDGSGKFERAEFGQLLKDVAKTLLPKADEMTLVVPPAMVDKVYKDKEGLTVDEIYAALKRCISYIKSQLQLKELFNAVDSDGNGMLNKSELKQLLIKACPPSRKVREADVAFVLEKCDVNGDDCIDINELGLAVACWLEVIKTMPDPGAAEEKKSSACVLL
jgi:Ca2+-binding EF-hand superfamily protein